MSHIIREYADEKNETISECFTIKNNGFTFVSFSSPHSLSCTDLLLLFKAISTKINGVTLKKPAEKNTDILLSWFTKTRAKTYHVKT